MLKMLWCSHPSKLIQDVIKSSETLKMLWCSHPSNKMNSGCNQVVRNIRGYGVRVLQNELMVQLSRQKY